MNYIDLHVHTNVSDGTLTPREVVDLAVKKNLAAIAITDHDTVGGLEEAMLACKEHQLLGHTLTLVPGVELSAEYHGRDVHLLGLLIDYKNEHLRNTLIHAQEERTSRNETMAARFRADGIPLELKDLVFEQPNAVITRAHFARYLTGQGFVKTNAEAFVKYLGDNSKYYVKRNYMTLKTAIDLILASGGIPVLAHPLLYHLSLEELDELVAHLKSLGLVGLETIYSSHTGMDEGIVRRFVNKYDLLMTGGSDFHGTNKPQLELGTGRGNLKIPSALLTNLINWKEQNPVR